LQGVVVRCFDDERLDTAGVPVEAVVGVRLDRRVESVTDIHHPAFDLRFVVSRDGSNRRQYPPVLVVCLLVLFEQ